MSVRLQDGSSCCGSRKAYTREACTPIYEIKAGDAKIITVDFCDGKGHCGGPVINQEPTVSTPEPVILGPGHLIAQIKDWDGCTADILIDAANAGGREQYSIRVMAQFSNCERISECFNIKIKGDCVVQCPDDEQKVCDKFLGHQKVCGQVTQSLMPPIGTTHAEVHVSSDALQYTLDGSQPAGAPALYANLGHVITLSNYQEVAGFRADPYCEGKDVAFIVNFYGC